MADRRARGAAVEQFVAEHLQSTGYQILDRNWQVRGGEIDIVALDGDVVAFVEVRARRAGGPISAEDSVGSAKLSRLVKSAQRYLQAYPEHSDRFWRIDLVAVDVDRSGLVKDLRHYENVILD